MQFRCPRSKMDFFEAGRIGRVKPAALVTMRCPNM